MDSERLKFAREPIEWGAGVAETGNCRLGRRIHLTPALSPRGGEGARSEREQRFDDLFGGHAGGAGLGEDGADGGQERDLRFLIFDLRLERHLGNWVRVRLAPACALLRRGKSVAAWVGEVVEGFEGAAGPVAARSLRDGE